MQSLTYVAPCLFGLERHVKEELADLGLAVSAVTDGRVTFEGPPEAMAKANLHLRCAERVLIQLASFEAPTFDALFEGVKAVDWAQFADRGSAVVVTGSSLKSALSSIPACQRIVKKAIAVKLCAAYGLNELPETGAALQVQFFLFKDTVSILLDTSGQPLFKRGYRRETNTAPLRETLAAALVRQAHYRGAHAFADPMCGSGTIVIEAAMRASNRAPGMFRRFAFEQLPFGRESWLKREKEAAQAAVTKPEVPFYAFDSDPAMRELTQHNADRAGVAQLLTIRTAQLSAFAPPDARGTLICNPPYGERMSERRECEQLYRHMGKVLLPLSGWDLSIITSHEQFEKFFGRPADKKRKLYNGMIKCDLYQYYKQRTGRPESD